MNIRLFGATLICAWLTTACAHRSGVENSPSLDGSVTVNAVLEETVGTKSNKTGDRVTAVSVEPFKTSDGLMIPSGSKLLGKVTYVRGANAGEYQAILGLAFDTAVIDQREIPLNASVRALAIARYPGATADKPRPNSAAGIIGERFGGGRKVIFNSSKAATVSAKVIERRFPKSPGAVGGLDAKGLLVSQSRGVFGLAGMNVNERAEAGTITTLISTILNEVKLESGTRILLMVNEPKSEGGAHSGAMP